MMILGGCVLVGILGVALWPGEREPEYKGKKLSEWLDEYNSPAAKQAISAIGTRALPFLVTWIRNEHPEWREGLNNFARRWGLFEKRVERDDNQRKWLQINAPYGFKELGVLALPAVPQLTNLFCDPNWNNGGVSAGEALAYLGPAWPQAIPLVCRSLTNRSPAVRERAVQACAFMKESRDAVVPALTLACGTATFPYDMRRPM